MNVLAWLAVVGYIINAGAMLVSYAVSVGNPEGAKNLYMGFNLFSLRQYDFWEYTGIVALQVAIVALEAYIAFLVTKVLSKIKMSNPFSMEVANTLQKISYIILFTWVVSLIYNGHVSWLAKKIPGLNEHLVPGEFLLVAGVVFVFAQIFKKGVELQTENELTV